MQRASRTEFGRWTAIANRKIKIVERRPVVDPEAQSHMQATRKAIALRRDGANQESRILCIVQYTTSTWADEDLQARFRSP